MPSSYSGVTGTPVIMQGLGSRLLVTQGYGSNVVGGFFATVDEAVGEDL